MILRDYQEAAVQALFDYFAKADGHPLVEAPTGAGKSLIIAEFVQRALRLFPETRIIMLTHVKELVEQNAEKLVALWEEGTPPVGIYSAGLGFRDCGHPIIFGGIQSVYRCLDDFGRRDLVIIDEAHLLPKSGAGMYRTCIDAVRAANPAAKVVGFTATPYRLDGGYLHAGSDRLFTDIAYTIPVGKLVAEGYLSPVVSREPANGQIGTDGVATRSGDFVAGELEQAALASNVELAVNEMARIGHERRARSWLVFACGVDHATEIVGLLQRLGVSAEMVLGSTDADARADIIERFKAGTLRCLVNVNVLTTGFDAPGVDLLAMMRPTQSTSLYVQIVGRGTRTAPGKEKCMVLDYGGNVRRHGPIDKVAPKFKGKGGSAPMKECPYCLVMVPTGTRECPDCGYEYPFEERVAGHDSTADTAAVMTFGPPEWEPPREVKVQRVDFTKHEKDGKPPSVRVTYLHAAGATSEWWCFDHGGFAAKKAHEAWDSLGGVTFGKDSTADALDATWSLTLPSTITIKAEGKYDRVIGRCIDPPLRGPLPGPDDIENPGSDWDLDELPF